MIRTVMLLVALAVAGGAAILAAGGQSPVTAITGPPATRWTPRPAPPPPTEPASGWCTDHCTLRPRGANNDR